jgi:RNA polymerase sigma factor (sigma-70 family)
MESVALMSGVVPVLSPDVDHFYRTHRVDAVRWAVALVGDRAVAEELAQDALIAVCGRLEGLDNPTGYLRRTVVNRAASWHRSNAREQRRIHRVAAGQPTSYSVETHEMLGALASLPYKQRAAVALRFWDDWTDEQIAEALGCAPASVRVLVHRALVSLKKEIS